MRALDRVVRRSKGEFSTELADVLAQVRTGTPLARAFDDLAAPGPAILHALVDPAEIPSMPHIEPGEVWKFGIAKLKERLAAVTGR